MLKQEKKWNGLLFINNFEIVRDNKIIFKKENFTNTLHAQGELFMLNLMCNSGTVPANYYLGLDNRSTISLTDTLSSLVGEPTGNGYNRQPISSTSGFTISQQVNGNYVATVSLITYSATGSGWGPIQNIFLATTANNSGSLLGTAPIGSSSTLVSGDVLNLGFNFALSN